MACLPCNLPPPLPPPRPAPQWSNFGMGGWWLGGSHMKPNPAFMSEVQVRPGGGTAELELCWAAPATSPDCLALGLAGDAPCAPAADCIAAGLPCPLVATNTHTKRINQIMPAGLHPQGRLGHRGLPEGPALPGRLRAAEPRGVSAAGAAVPLAAPLHAIRSAPLRPTQRPLLRDVSMLHCRTCSYGPLAWINGGFDTAAPGDLATKDGVDIRLGGERLFFAVFVSGQRWLSACLAVCC